MAKDKVSPYSQEAMRARLKELDAEISKMQKVVDKAMAEYAPLSEKLGKAKKTLVEAKAPLIDLMNEKAAIHRALGAKGIALEPGSFGVKNEK